MAKAQEGIYGPVSGKIGGVVWVQTKGGLVARGYNGSPKKSESAARKKQNGRMTAGSRLSKLLVGWYLNDLWGKEHDGTSARNRWFGPNVQNLLWKPDAQYPKDKEKGRVLVEDRERFVLADGKVAGPALTGAVATPGVGLVVSWDAGVNLGSPYDQVYVVVWNKTQEVWLLQPVPTSRVAVTTTVVAGAGQLAAGDELWIWSAVLRKPGMSPGMAGGVSKTESLAVVM